MADKGLVSIEQALEMVGLVSCEDELEDFIITGFMRIMSEQPEGLQGFVYESETMHVDVEVEVIKKGKLQ